MKNNLKKLTVLRNLLNDNVFGAFSESLDGDEESFYKFVAQFFNDSQCAEIDFAKYVENLIIYDENVVSRCFAEGKKPLPQIIDAYLTDIKSISRALQETDPRGFYNCDISASPILSAPEAAITDLGGTYQKFGYGRFLKNYAFLYDEGNLIPSGNFDDANIAALKEYATEKKLVADNMESFILGLPYSDMLLYGDMGTGKSSTIRAMVKKYADRKLRLIEVDRKNLPQIPEIRRLAATFPMKFIIFIDDLSIDGSDEKLSSLKVCLEGSSAVYKNSMIAATSNRRHIVKENFSDRENAVHSGDVMQEQLSLSDRFGLTVMFSSTGKDEYLSIVKQLAADAHVMLNEAELCELAERWAILRGGRSPRRAKQFVDMVYAAGVKGIPVEF